MKRCAIVLALLVSILPGIGCAHQMTQAEIGAMETRRVDAPYDDTYLAATGVLFDLGYTITHSDKASGLITGENKVSRANDRAAAYLALGVAGLLIADEERKVTMLIREVGPQASTVRMKLTVQGKQSKQREVYTTIWNKILRQLMLDEIDEGP